MKRALTLLLLFVCLITSTLSAASVSDAAPLKMRLNVKSIELTKNRQYTLRVYNVKKKYKVYFRTDQKDIIRLPKIKPKKRKIKFTAINVGTAKIDVNIRYKKKLISKLSCDVNVTPQAISIKFPKKNIETTVGRTILLNPIIKPNNSACIPVYTSSDERIAEVNAKGRVLALSAGEVIITASLPNGQSTSCKLKIWEPAPWSYYLDQLPFIT